MRAGLRALQERDEAIERWLREEVAPTFDAVKNGGMATHPLDAVIGEIDQGGVVKPRRVGVFGSRQTGPADRPFILTKIANIWHN